MSTKFLRLASLLLFVMSVSEGCLSNLPFEGTAEALNFKATATASSVQKVGYEAGKAIDENMTTRWSSKFSDPQWLTVDMLVAKTVTRVVLTWEAAYAKNYQIQISSNNTTWTTLATVVNGDGGLDDNTGLNGTGRYLRIFGTKRGTQYGYSLIEIQIVTTPPPDAGPEFPGTGGAGPHASGTGGSGTGGRP